MGDTIKENVVFYFSFLFQNDLKVHTCLVQNESPLLVLQECMCVYEHWVWTIS